MFTSLYPQDAEKITTATEKIQPMLRILRAYTSRFYPPMLDTGALKEILQSQPTGGFYTLFNTPGAIHEELEKTFKCAFYPPLSSIQEHTLTLSDNPPSESRSVETRTTL